MENKEVNIPRIKLDDAYEKNHSDFQNKITNLRKGESVESLRNEMDIYYESQGVNVKGLKQEIKDIGKQWDRLTPLAQKILRKQKGRIGYWMYNMKENTSRHEIDYESEERKIILKLAAKEDIQNLKQKILSNIKVFEDFLPKKKRTQKRITQIEKLKLEVKSAESTSELYGYEEFVDIIINRLNISLKKNPKKIILF